MADMVLDMYLVAHDQFAGVFEKLGVEAEGLRGKIGLLAGGFGVLAGGVLAESVKQASDYSSMINHVAANTTMTTQGINEMSKAVEDMAAHSSAHMDDLAQAWMHVTDLGFNKAADAQKVVQAAMESALSTGGSVVATANVLANAMHEFGMKATDAGHAMDVLHLASAEGNTTLEDFVDGAGRAIGMAANLGVSLTDASAAISALTRHGFDASTASTQLIGLLEHITNPAAGAQKALAALSQQTGIDLVHDFSQAGLHAKGLSGVLADVQRATHGNSAEIEKLIPALRGGLSAMTLTGTGAADYAQILSALNDTMAGKTNPTAEAYARTQQTLGFQVQMLKNNLQEMAISIGSAVLPALTGLVQAVMPVVQGIARWLSHHGQLVAALLAGVAVVGTLIGALMILGPVIAAIASPVGIVVLAIGAAVAGLVALVAHSEGVRAFLSGIWSSIVDDATALWAWLNGVWAGITQDAQTLWEDLGGWLIGIWQGIVSVAGPIWNGVADAFKYVWSRITGDKTAAGNDLALIPTQWRPLVQAIGDVLAGSWFTVKYIWDSLFGSHAQATQDLTNIPPEWRPLVQDIGTALSGSWFTVKYLWDDITGNHNAATADLKAIPPEWRPLVRDIGNVLSGSFMTVTYLWDDITGNHNAATADLQKIPPEWRPLVASIGNVFTEAKKDIGSFFDAVGTEAQKIWNTIGKPTLEAMKNDWNRFVHDLAPLIGPALATIKGALNDAAAPFKFAMGVIVGALSAVWSGFWHGDKKGGAKQLLLDGLGFLATTIKAAAHILEDAVLVVMALVGGKWGVAWTKITDMVGTWFGWIKDAMKAKDTILGDGADIAIAVLKKAFGDLVTGAIKWGEDLIENIKKGIGNKAHDLYEAVRNALGPIGKLFPKSPAEEGPLSIPPDFMYIAHAMQAAIPHVHAAGMQLMGATGLSGGSLSLDVGAAGGLGGVAGTAATFNAGHTVTIAPTINISGGTFSDRQSISDLAHQVSEEIMHSVRLQGGLLPQM